MQGLKGFCKKQDVDLVVSFNFNSGAPCPEVTYHINVIPYLPFGERLRYVGAIRAVFQRVFSRAALRNSDLNIFESKYIRDLGYQKNVPKNALVSYIGSELPKHEMRATAANREIVCVTSGQSHKRNDMAVAIFKGLQDPDARLTFIGNEAAILGSLTDENRAWVRSSESVTFAGYLNREQLFSWLRGSWCLLSCSELESFYMVAVEAMAVGCPAVVANKTSAQESVGTAGLLFDDIDQAVLQLKKLGDNDFWAQVSEQSYTWSQAFEADTCAAEFIGKVGSVLE
jgi:glycosyltransferase involved in cell wall biosynthesis